MTNLIELYSDLFRIDLDTPGGYARVVQVTTHGQNGFPSHCAFKLMRHELDYNKGLARFENEIKTLIQITKDNNAPSSITRIYDSGFVQTELSNILMDDENFDENLEIISPGKIIERGSGIKIISTGKDVENFLETKANLKKRGGSLWLPYLVVELAPYNTSLYRLIHNNPQLPNTNHKIPPSDVISMTIQLLDVLEYLHKTHRKAYIDWKPEHIFWNNISKQVKLIDWNVNTYLDDQSGEKQNIREDVRLLCGACLYSTLAWVDPMTVSKKLTVRYLIDNPSFYQNESKLDTKIKRLVRKGLDLKQGFNSPQELKTALLEYAQQELGQYEDNLSSGALMNKETSKQRQTKKQDSSTVVKHSNFPPSNSQIDAARDNLLSERVSAIWQGMSQVRQWLSENPENQEVYGMLLDSVQKNHDLRESVRNLLVEMVQNGSNSAQKVITMLPSSAQDLLADADDAYYASEYTQAIQLYRQVLKLDPDNVRAKDHLSKAKLEQLTTGQKDFKLPREAAQYYRQARSYIAARDYLTATKLLSAAIESAQARSVTYTDAEELLNSVQDSLIADELRQRANLALERRNWKEALDLYEKATILSPADEVIKEQLASLKDLLKLETEMRDRRVMMIFISLNRMQNTLTTARSVIGSDNTLVNLIEKQLNQIRMARVLSAAILIIIFSYSLFTNQILNAFPLVPKNTPTLMSTNITATTDSSTPIPSKTQTLTPSPTTTPTITPTTTPPPTGTTVILGMGYINKAVASTWRGPNEGLITRLSLNQVVTILEQIVVGGSRWYRCTWSLDGVTSEGWILAEYITFGPPPP